MKSYPVGRIDISNKIYTYEVFTNDHSIVHSQNKTIYVFRGISKLSLNIMSIKRGNNVHESQSAKIFGCQYNSK